MTICKMNQTLTGGTNFEKEEKKPKRKWMWIDTTLLIPKLVYFILGAKTSSYEPFMVVFMISIGLTPSQAGLVGGLRVIGALLGSPFWAFIADLKNVHKHIGLILCIGSLLFMFMQPFVSLSIGESIQNQCPELASSTRNTTGNVSLSEKHFIDNKNPNNNLFYVMLFINILAKFFDGAQAGFVDNAIVYRCSQHPSKPEFGKQRLFGSFGFGTGVMLTTFAVNYFPDAGVTCYAGMTAVYCLLSLVFTVIFWRLYNGVELFKSNDDDNEGSLGTVKVLMKTLFKAESILFFMTVLVMGLMQSLYISFTVLFLRDIGANSLVNGVSIAIAALSCLVTFFYGSKIITFLHGSMNTIVLCCFSYFVRFIAVGYLTEPWLMPLIQTLQSIGFGLFVLTSVLYIKEISPIEIRTTMYGIFNAIFYGGSFVIGNVAGGYIYAYYKAKNLFIWAAYFALGWTLLLLIYIVVKKLMSENKETVKDKGENELLAKVA